MPFPLRQIVKETLRRFDVSVSRRSQSPEVTLLGLRGLAIRTILDIGANEGQFGGEFAKLFPEARVHCFEPLPTAYAKLKAWAASTDGQASAHNLALGERSGTADMFQHVDHTASSSLLPSTELSDRHYPASRTQERTEVRLLTLDSAVAEFGIRLEPGLLIKMDVQGYEDRVLAGGPETFRRADACIVEVCLDPLYKGQADFPSLVAALDILGFRYAGNLQQSCAEDGHVIYIDSLFRRPACP